MNPQPQELYEADFYAWTKQQAKYLQENLWAALDIPNLVEEIASLGKQQRQELRNCLGVLLGHLLKWQFQPQQRSKSWLATIREQRRRTRDLLQESPSLKPFLSEMMVKAYQDGLDLAVRETDLDYSEFPSECLYSQEQVLDDLFLPNSG